LEQLCRPDVAQNLLIGRHVRGGSSRLYEGADAIFVQIYLRDSFVAWEQYDWGVSVSGGQIFATEAALHLRVVFDTAASETVSLFGRALYAIASSENFVEYNIAMSIGDLSLEVRDDRLVSLSWQCGR
jgi:hypothetical protein